ncbi:kinase-like protein [Marasmius fiardii PR-910]|nr:kinase-like protein [Marasmius fiardii PR-910]
MEQKLSAQIVAEGERERERDESMMAPPLAAVAAIHPSQSAPLLQDEPPVAMSPAAMFLSAFSPPPSAIKYSLPDDEGEVVAGYTLNGIIGYGGSSTIRRAYSPSGGVVAVKIVRNSDLLKQGNSTEARRRLDHETSVWSTLCHEHILPLFTSVHTSYADFFVTLLCPAGSLFDILKRDGRPALPQDDAGMMLRQVVRGLRYLHEEVQYVHRDMKLENVLVDESGTCKIGDFGMARKIGEIVEDDIEEEEEEFLPPIGGIQRAASVSQPSPPITPRRTGLGGMPLHHSLRLARHRTATSASASHPPKSVRIIQPGSLPYAAPELLAPSSDSGVHPPDPAQDMWALGVMLYALLTGRLPFVDSFEPRLQMKILHAVYDIPRGIGSGAERILQGCLDRCVASRWTVAMVDEVAWGVGWGTENVDLVTDEELRYQTTSHSRSRSRVGDIHVPQTPAWDHVSTRTAASADVASRRSVSRTRRSLSRAPALTDDVSSERSVERHGRRLPRTALSMSTSGSSSPSSSSASSSGVRGHAVDHDDDPFPFVERGRRLQKSVVTLVSHTNQILSRSPSPSVLPKTPTDISTGQFSPPPPLQEDDDDDHIEVEDQDHESKEHAHTSIRFADPATVNLPSHLRSSSSKSGIHTPSSIHSRNGDLRDHPDDPRHRIFSITASPRSDLVELEPEDIEPSSAVGEEWGNFSLTSSEGDGGPFESFAAADTLQEPVEESSFAMARNLKAASLLAPRPGPIVESRSCEDDKSNLLEEWGKERRSRMMVRRGDSGSSTTARAGSMPPAPCSSEDAGSWRFSAAASSSSASTSRRRTPSRGRRTVGGGILSSMLSTAINIPGRSRSVDQYQHQYQPSQFKPQYGKLGV